MALTEHMVVLGDTGGVPALRQAMTRQEKRHGVRGVNGIRSNVLAHEAHRFEHLLPMAVTRVNHGTVFKFTNVCTGCCYTLDNGSSSVKHWDSKVTAQKS